jgi:uncharacterized protein (TIGR02231 family)
MRIVVSSAVFSLLSISPAFAAEVTATSRIDTVTVFPSGAEIARTVRAMLDSGEHKVLVEITGQADPASIRVEGAANGKFEIGSVDTRVINLSSTDPAIAQSARKKIADEIEALSDQRSAEDDMMHAASVQQSYLENLAKLPERPHSANAGAPHEDWNALFGLLEARIPPVAKAITEAKLRQRALDRKIDDLRRQLDITADGAASRTQISINVSAGAPLDAALVLRYQVAPASWSPFYDARLTTAGAGAETPPRLAIVRRASIVQTTGEDWDDVKLALSTTRPGTATAAPDLKVLSVDFATELRPREDSALEGALRNRDDSRSASNQLQQAAAQGQGTSVPPSFDNDGLSFKAPAAEKIAQAEITAFQAVYTIDGRSTIKASGEAKRLQILAEEMDTTLLVKSVPRLDRTAYLYAKLSLPKASSPLLPGQAALVRDGVFVGTGALPPMAPGEAYELGFGADERVRIKRAVIEDKKGETGTFSTSKVEERRYAITIKNLHTRAMDVQILDRVPVSLQQDIVVDLTVTAGPQPTKLDANSRRGVMLWQVKAAPGEEKQIGFGYRVSAPGNRPIQYRELTDEQNRLRIMLSR